MASQTVIHLMRHGEVENPEGVIYERLPDFHLSKRGQKMAERNAQFIKFDFCLSKICAAYSSPMDRTIETIRPTSQALGLNLILDDRLIEAEHRLAGQNGKAAILKMVKKFQFGKLFSLIFNPFLPSWGESYQHISQRMTSAINDIKNNHRGQHVLVCSHQNPIWVARLTYDSKRIWHNPAKRICALASITSLYFDDESDQLQKIVYHTPSRDL